MTLVVDKVILINTPKNFHLLFQLYHWRNSVCTVPGKMAIFFPQRCHDQWVLKEITTVVAVYSLILQHSLSSQCMGTKWWTARECTSQSKSPPTREKWQHWTKRTQKSSQCSHPQGNIFFPMSSLVPTYLSRYIQRFQFLFGSKCVKSIWFSFFYCLILIIIIWNNGKYNWSRLLINDSFGTQHKRNLRCI